jgi:hypothetical protein
MRYASYYLGCRAVINDAPPFVFTSTRFLKIFEKAGAFTWDGRNPSRRFPSGVGFSW